MKNYIKNRTHLILMQKAKKKKETNNKTAKLKEVTV